MEAILHSSESDSSEEGIPEEERKGLEGTAKARKPPDLFHYFCCGDKGVGPINTKSPHLTALAEINHNYHTLIQHQLVTKKHSRIVTL